ncbi:GcvT family protein [Arthrobacter sp. USHLN218]|uniref:GcvT family protein n=1 Tax=Arthrobacter sp. USHLN218 TaxID=3081232 RepID=UPI003018F0DC
MDRLVDKTIGAHLFLTEDEAAAPLPAQVENLVIGGGIAGASIAAHLAERGAGVALLEANVLGSGTTWHAAGLVTGSRTTTALTKLASYGIGLYSGLESRTGIDVAFERRGSLMVARTPGRADEVDYAYDVAVLNGVDAKLLEPEDVRSLWPAADPSGILKALLVPGDGHINPGYAAIALAKLAHEHGASIHEHVRVQEVLVEDGRAVGVRTDRGVVRAERVVLACGLWTRELAATAGAPVPLYPAEHVHVRTAKVADDIARPPVFRDLDNHYYIRGEDGHLLVGAFEPDGIPRNAAEVASNGFAEFPAAWEHFGPIRAKAEAAVPVLADTGFERFLNAPESFTPDGNFLLGETAEVGSLFIAAGFNSQGIIFAPGIGKELAEWMLSGAPGFDASAVDVRRFSRHQSNPRYLHERTAEALGRLYAMHWPQLQPVTARNVRRSPLHERAAALGACFGEQNGWERANWYGEPGSSPAYEYSYGRQNWFEPVRREHQAARNGVAIFDLSSFAKIEIAGPDALEVLQRTVTADVDVAPGKAVYTLALTSRGGIQLDGTVLRLEADRFWLITPAASQDLTLGLLRSQARGRAAAVFDATSGWAVLGVMGPQSRELLESVSPGVWSDADLPYTHSAEVPLGGGTVRALRLSFVGELGYELYVPAELAVAVFDQLWEAGSAFGARLAGYHALDSLRSEKGFRHLGHDIGPADDPYTAGLGFTVAASKDFGFTGGPALRDLDRKSLPERTVYVKLLDPEPLLHHDEAVLVSGMVVGQVTSGAYGHTVGAAVGHARVAAEVASAGEVEAQVRIKGVLVPALLSRRPFYDPAGERMRG